MIYLDNAATTQISESVKDKMFEMMTKYYQNPSSIYDSGVAVRMKIEKAREKIADTIGAQADEVFFTSSGSESDNWALRGIALKYANKGKHIITSKIEHKAVLKTCEYLEHIGYEINYLDVDADGNVSVQELEKYLRNDTILVSIMFANNEVGTIMKIRELTQAAHAKGALFHTDAVQAYGHIPINCEELSIDLMSVSGHKFHGPKGVGFLYKRRGIEIEPLIYGGSQEKNLRAGTESVVNIVGMAQAACESYMKIREESIKLYEQRNYLIDTILKTIPNSRLVGSKINRLPNNVCISIKGVDAIELVDYLGQREICISTGSACNSSSVNISHVLEAMGLEKESAKGTIRISISKYNSISELEKFVLELKQAINFLQQIY